MILEQYEAGNISDVSWYSLHPCQIWAADINNDWNINIIDIVTMASRILTDQDIIGCTDSEASNYNPNAAIEDGSCTYQDINMAFSTTYTWPNNGSEDDNTIPYYPDLNFNRFTSV